MGGVWVGPGAGEKGTSFGVRCEDRVDGGVPDGVV